MANKIKERNFEEKKSFISLGHPCLLIAQPILQLESQNRSTCCQFKTI